MARSPLWFPCLILALAVAKAHADPPTWHLKAECRMYELPQAVALTILPGLMEEETFKHGRAALEELVNKKQAKLVSLLFVQGGVKDTLKAEHGKEIAFGTIYRPPEMPYNLPKTGVVDFLNHWPSVTVTPEVIERRKTGQGMEVMGWVSDDGKWIDADVVLRDTRFLGNARLDIGLLPSGAHIYVEQPEFHEAESTFSLHVVSGQETLVGVHMLPGDEGMEFFLLRITARPDEESK